MENENLKWLGLKDYIWYTPFNKKNDKLWGCDKAQGGLY